MGTFPNKGTQFKPGVSGNPNGRRGYRQRAETLLDKACTDKSVEAIWANLVRMAEAGDLGATKLLLERLAPATERREVEQVESASAEQLDVALARIHALATTDGDDLEPEPKRTNGSNGAGV